FAQAAQVPGHRLAGFTCGLGLAYGPAIAGRLGTPTQFKVGVFGPVVNLAARLESLTRRLRVTVLVDEAVGRFVADGKFGDSRCRQLARVLPAGVARPVRVGELLPPAGEPGALSETHRRMYESALRAFEAGRWH